MNIFSNNLNKPTPFNLSEFSNLILSSPSQFWFLKILFFIHVVYLLFKKYSNEYWFLLFCIMLHGCTDLLLMPAEIARFGAFAIF